MLRPDPSIFLSPAKVNLCLKVLGKRPDGYHDIFSIMQPVDLYDEISIEVSEGEGISLVCDNPQVPSDKTNLAHKAAALFFKETGMKYKTHINIKKKIPVSAGLGGGSSNAAAVLIGLNRIMDTVLGEERMLKMASILGSDVPFFILKSSAIVTGRGELVERIDIPLYWYVIVNPGFEVSTAWTYNNLNLTKKSPGIRLSYSKNKLEERFKIEDLLLNDLEKVVLRAYPKLRKLKDLLSKVGAEGVLMSGSGPTVFGLFFKEDKARDAFDKLNRSLKDGVAIFLTRGIEGGR
ncbi:MAG: 4-(cytidine 5'-diphospho)-2-C-methyl-D-erythritol kinase [Thermodesulfobacteriota bacterium]